MALQCSGARIEQAGRFFAIVLVTAPLRIARSVALLAIGIAAWLAIGGVIFLLAAAIAAAGIVKQLPRAGRVTRRVIVRVGERGELITSDLPA